MFLGAETIETCSVPRVEVDMEARTADLAVVIPDHYVFVERTGRQKRKRMGVGDFLQPGVTRVRKAAVGSTGGVSTQQCDRSTDQVLSGS